MALLYTLDSTARFHQPLYYFVIKKIRTCFWTYTAYISVKHHLYKNLLRLTWKYTGSNSRVLTVYY